MFIETSVKKVTTTMVALSFGPGLLIFFVTLPNVMIGTILAGVVIVLGWQIPKLFVDNLYEGRNKKFNDQMVDGLTILANGVKAGLTVPNAMERVVENMANPIRQEFNLVLSQIRLGLSLEEAFNNLAERIPVADVQMFVMAVNILGETGGDMSETFQTIVETIRDRQKIQKKIEAMTAQGVWQGIIITLLPFGLMAMFLVMDPAFVMPMFTQPLGWALLFVMLVLQTVGGLMIRKIVRIEV
ncbi:MAG: type II secretion system F family protein [Bdellovibrionales bacterium]|nr:type II secretion system F family protein [Bdellovibrionales bacterium]